MGCDASERENRLSLKGRYQGAEKLSRGADQDAYEQEAKYLYGLLREAWERALEEVLLAGVVERYRPSVQTLKACSPLSDITAQDCQTVETAMTKVLDVVGRSR